MFNKFSPKEYPLHLSITFSKREVEFKNLIKDALNQIPKNQARYQNTGKVVNTFDCYFKDVDSMRPLLNNVLSHTDMFTQYMMEEDRKVFKNDLLSTGTDLLAVQSKAL